MLNLMIEMYILKCVWGIVFVSVTY